MNIGLVSKSTVAIRCYYKKADNCEPVLEATMSCAK